MGRRSGGHDLLAVAKASLSKAKTIEGLRKLQAVVLSLEYGLTLEQTAQVTGVSVGWVSQLRNRFIQEGGSFDNERPRRGGRYRQNMNREEEERFLAPFIAKASSRGILVVSEIKEALDRRLGRKVALSSAYNLLHRHNWRKLSPDKRHPQSDIQAQNDWKKIRRHTCRNQPRLAGKRSPPPDVHG
jgi:transposase